VAMSSKFTTARHVPFTRSDLSIKDQQCILKALAIASSNGARSLDAGLEKSIEEFLGVRRALLTTSLDYALDIAAKVLAWGPEDEVILPSFASMSIASAIMDRGARPVFAEIDEATWNIDPVDVASRIASQTRAIIPVHYAGQSCDMLLLTNIAKRFGLTIVEDASQALGAKFAGKPLGTRGTIGCFGFHFAMNTIRGEIGVFVTNDPHIAEKAEAIRDRKPQCRSWSRKDIDTYLWVNEKSLYARSDVLMVLARSQLIQFEYMRQQRRVIWWHYQDWLSDLAQTGNIVLPWIDMQAGPNWHTYAFRVADPAMRDPLLSYLNLRGVEASAHYTPLHSSPLAQNYLEGATHELPITDRVSKSLVRLPIYQGLTLEDQEYVIEVLLDFFAPRT